MRTLLHLIYTAYAGLLFTIGLLVRFPIILLVSIPNNAWSRRNIWRILRRWARIWLWMTGMPQRRSGPVPSPGRYVIVGNHISYLDTVVVFPAIPTYFRPLGKQEMVKMPILGYVYKQIVITVKRDSPHNRARSQRLMWRALRNESSIFLFPEGTFNEGSTPLKDFYDGAFRLAINAQTPIWPMVFPDTFARWHGSKLWKMSPGRNRAIYLPLVDVKGLTQADVPMLRDKVYKMMEEALLKAKS